MTDPSVIDAGLLLLRLTAGGLSICHGLQKFTHLFGGGGLAGAGEAFTALGFRGNVRTALAAGGTQLLLGPMLVLGLATPLGGAALIGVMVVAALAHAPNGLWAQKGGFEYPLVLAVIGAALALTGPGTIALDTEVLNWKFPTGTGAAAVGIGVVSGLVTGLALRRAPSVGTQHSHSSTRKETGDAAYPTPPRSSPTPPGVDLPK